MKLLNYLFLATAFAQNRNRKRNIKLKAPKVDGLREIKVNGPENERFDENRKVFTVNCDVLDHL